MNDSEYARRLWKCGGVDSAVKTLCGELGFSEVRVGGGDNGDGGD